MAGLTEKKEKAKKEKSNKEESNKEKRKRTGKKILIIMNMEYVPMSCTC